jgi:hypothetical protein
MMVSISSPMPSQSFVSFGGLEGGFRTPKDLFLMDTIMTKF